jgi:hypothetical protein
VCVLGWKLPLTGSISNSGKRLSLTFRYNTVFVGPVHHSVILTIRNGNLVVSPDFLGGSSSEYPGVTRNQILHPARAAAFSSARRAFFASFPTASAAIGLVQDANGLSNGESSVGTIQNSYDWSALRNDVNGLGGDVKAYASDLSGPIDEFGVSGNSCLGVQNDNNNVTADLRNVQGDVNTLAGVINHAQADLTAFQTAASQGNKAARYYLSNTDAFKRLETVLKTASNQRDQYVSEANGYVQQANAAFTANAQSELEKSCVDLLGELVKEFPGLDKLPIPSS